MNRAPVETARARSHTCVRVRKQVAQVDPHVPVIGVFHERIDVTGSIWT